METNLRNQSIDLIKVIAMFMVMALHTIIRPMANIATFYVPTMSGIAIPLFFMVSGFLLIDKKSDYKYSLKKIFSILKFVAIVCFVYYVVFMLRKGFDIKDFPKLFIGSFVQRGGMSVFWYFGAMIIIYMLLPFINKLYKKYINFGLYSVLCLGCIVFITYMLNVTITFERTYIIQTFRIWNWLFYFCFGGLIKSIYIEREREGKIGVVDISSKNLLLIVLIIQIIYVAFCYYMWTYLKGIEYYFGSLLCIVYAAFVFCFALSLRINNNRIISIMSSLFLPVYAIHRTVIHLVSGHTTFLGGLSPIVDYILVVIITISASYGIMKLPLMDKIFKI